MKRRAFLSAVVCSATAGCMAGLPGPTGPRNPPQEPENDPRESSERSPLIVDSFEFADAGDGSLLATVYVKNRSDIRRSATVVGEVTLGDESYVETAEGVEIGPSETLAVDLEYDVSYAKFQRNGGFEPSLE